VASRRTYTDEDKGRVFAALTINEGNATRTARELGLPKPTVVKWKKEWEKNGPSKEVMVAAEAQAEQFIADATRIRDKALSKWEAKVDEDEVAARDLMTGVGVLTDKLNAARTLKAPEQKEQLSPAHMRELARGLIEGAVTMAKQREEEIIEADYEVVEPLELPKGTRE
jgi:transposase-like protein